MTPKVVTLRVEDGVAAPVGWEQIKHEPKLYTIPASEAMGAITGAEMLEIDWMLDWEENE